jgi:hypothetical protein
MNYQILFNLAMSEVIGHFKSGTGLTCLACRLVFADALIQKQHYAKDWHRYNLKRHVGISMIDNVTVHS